MSRPLNADIVQGLESWDTDVRDNQRALFKTPAPLPNGTYELADATTEGTAYTVVGSLPSAGSHDGCTAVVNSSGNWIPYFSNGTAWERVTLWDGTDINALIDNSGGTSGGDTIAVTTNIANVSDAIATLAAKVNAIIAALGLDI